MDQYGFKDANEDPMYAWMLQQLTSQNNQQGQGQGGGGGAMGALMKAFGGGNKQQGSYGGFDAGTGDSYTQFSGGDFGFGGFA